AVTTTAAAAFIVRTPKATIGVAATW
ncbi:hypothetical protein D021_0393B, partial [Vibrio parahaemolyticus 10296]